MENANGVDAAAADNPVARCAAGINPIFDVPGISSGHMRRDGARAGAIGATCRAVASGIPVVRQLPMGQREPATMLGETR